MAFTPKKYTDAVKAMIKSPNKETHFCSVAVTQLHFNLQSPVNPGYVKTCMNSYALGLSRTNRPTS